MTDNYVYLLSTNCRVEYKNKKGTYRLYKIGTAKDVSARQEQFDSPIKTKVLSKVLFPSVGSSLTCENFLLVMFYPEQRLHRIKAAGDWIALDKKQLNVITKHLEQFNDAEIMNRFCKDAPTIRRELQKQKRSYDHVCRVNLGVYKLADLLKVKQLVMEL